MATRSTHPRAAVAGARAGLLAGLLPHMRGAPAPRARRRPLGLVLVIALLGAPSPGSAQTKETLKVQIPTAPVRLLAADCSTFCWLSGLFAPAVVRERVAAVAITNASDVPVSLTARVVPSNGLALEYLAGHLTLQDSDRNDALAAATPLPVGETVNLKIAAALGDGLPAGLYSAQLQLRATADAAAPADPVAQAVAVELRVRDSALWALLAVLIGILFGRLAQLVYDPKLIARVQLLDWLYALRDRIDRLTDQAQATLLRNDLMGLMRRLTGRGVDAATLQPEVVQLDLRIAEAERPPQPAEDLAVRREHARPPAPHRPNLIAWALRVLAGVSPLPLQSVYDWLLPLLMLFTLAALTFVFVSQQYGGSGTAETFGAGGLADYAALFLAGVASDAIAGGLRSIKFAAPSR